MYDYVKQEINNCIYAPKNEQAKFLELIENNKTSFHERENLNGHITASMLVFNDDYTKVLLALHGKFNRWLQLGGHWDEINETSLQTAIREMFEEGFGDKEVPFELLIQSPLDLDVHNAFTHEHYDLCYACKVSDESLAQCSFESKEVKWVDINEVINNTDVYRPRIGRMIKNALELVCDLNTNSKISTTAKLK